jgi:acetolactate synthase-1/2/3 large subunit
VLIGAISEAMSANDLLVPGSSGACSEITMQAFRAKAGMRVFNSEGLGPMGFGVPAALGGCLASGGRRTVCIDGDGGFHMNSQELETIRRLGLPIKFFVLCNDGYASIRNSQRNYFAGRYVASDASSGLTLPDTRRIAEAYGIGVASIEDHSHLRPRIREVLDRPGPVVCTVRVSPDQMTAPRLSSMARPDGTIVSKPLEDLFPFLDRDEFRSNMIVPPVEE